MMSSEVGGFGLPSLKRHGTGAPLAPVTTTPWMENAPATQAMMMVPPQMATPWLYCPPFQAMPHSSGWRQQAQTHAQQPTTKQEAAP
jgi:hypothetical protein